MGKKESQINLFIDTNILLGFYRFTNDDLEILSKLEDVIIKTSRIKLYATQQQVDEFYRNREVVIKQSIDSIKIEKPVLPRTFSEHKDYSSAVRQAHELVDKINNIKRDTLKLAITNDLKADKVAKNIFRSAIPTSVESLEKAKNRIAIGNPPGKKGSLGDAINWEILLENVNSDEMLTDINIISDDIDFRSALDSTKLNPFLKEEWSKSKFGTAHLYTSLNDFFKVHFPDLELLDESIKDGLIEQIGSAGSFDNARTLIKQLLSLGNLSENQARNLYISSITNPQVYRAHEYSPTIVGDKLWELIGSHWKSFDKHEQEQWEAKFPDEMTRNMWDVL